MSASPSGEQWTISARRPGGHRRRGRRRPAHATASTALDVLAGYADDEHMPPPAGARCSCPGPTACATAATPSTAQDYQLALTEPARGNASHGLVRWAPWQLLWHRYDVRAHRRATACTRSRAGPDASTSGQLRPRRRGPDRSATHADERRRQRRVPFGCRRPSLRRPRRHPAGRGRAHRARRRARCSSTTSASSPPAPPPVGDPGRLPHRRGRWGTTRLDTAFTGLTRDRATAAWEVEVGGLRAPASVTVWGDEAFDWVQVFTDKGEDEGVDGVRGIAVEPHDLPGRRVQHRRRARGARARSVVVSPVGDRPVRCADRRGRAAGRRLAPVVGRRCVGPAMDRGVAGRPRAR